MGKLMEFLRPYRVYVALVLVLTFVQTMSSLYLPNMMSDIVDTGIVHGNQPYIWREGLLMLAVTAGGGLASVIARYYGAMAMAGFGRLLRSRIFSHVESFSLKEFDEIGTSSLIVRGTNDVWQVQQFITMALTFLVMAPLTAIGGIILAVRTDPGLSLTIVVVVPVMGFVIWLVMRQGFDLFRSIQRKIDTLNLVLRENLTGVRVVRAFGRVDYETRRFDQANLDLTDTSVRVFQLMALMMPLVMLIMNLATVAIFWFGAVQMNQGSFEVGNLMAFIQYVMQIMFAVLMVSMMLFQVPRAQASAARIQEVLELEPGIADPVQPLPAVPGSGIVEFRHVTFHYPGGEEPALEDVSFTARPGEVTAIIGGTGAGKSTLLNLVLRFYDTSSGQVLVDGADVRAMRQHDLRHRLAYVPQRAVLFTGSVLDNIRYGDPQASAEAAMHAAAIAQASGFVRDMDGGLDAEVSQGGVNLSGGQRQRLAMARALARHAEIYLFDDTFSALDFKTDSLVRAALRRELKGQTVLIVAQRVSTVMDADQILVLDDGKLVGAGNHQHLMHDCPVYREIVSSQLSPEEIA